MDHSDKFKIVILKIGCRGSRAPANAEFGHFTFLFWRGRQRNVPRIITNVPSHYSAGNMLDIVVFLNSVMSFWVAIILVKAGRPEVSGK